MKTASTLKVGDWVQVCASYTGDIIAVGPIPDSDPCPGHRGKPGFLLDWDRVEIDARESIHETTGDTSWVPQTQCVRVPWETP